MIKIRILKIVVLFIFLILQGCGVEPIDKRCNGKGKITYSNATYVGECKKGKREGHGIITYSNGAKYDGQWENDNKEGNGKYITQYGIYNGIWKDDKLIEVTNQNSYEEAYTYYNNIRKQAGMIKLKTNGILEEGDYNS